MNSQKNEVVFFFTLHFSGRISFVYMTGASRCVQKCGKLCLVKVLASAEHLLYRREICILHSQGLHRKLTALSSF